MHRGLRGPPEQTDSAAPRVTQEKREMQVFLEPQVKRVSGASRDFQAFREPRALLDLKDTREREENWDPEAFRVKKAAKASLGCLAFQVKWDPEAAKERKVRWVRPGSKVLTERRETWDTWVQSVRVDSPVRMGYQGFPALRAFQGSLVSLPQRST